VSKDSDVDQVAFLVAVSLWLMEHAHMVISCSKYFLFFSLCMYYWYVNFLLYKDFNICDYQVFPLYPGEDDLNEDKMKVTLRLTFTFCAYCDAQVKTNFI
jgi:hypothetical protein